MDGKGDCGQTNCAPVPFFCLFSRKKETGWKSAGKMEKGIAERERMGYNRAKENECSLFWQERVNDAWRIGLN